MFVFYTVFFDILDYTHTAQLTRTDGDIDTKLVAFDFANLYMGSTIYGYCLRLVLVSVKFHFFSPLRSSAFIKSVSSQILLTNLEPKQGTEIKVSNRRSFTVNR